MNADGGTWFDPPESWWARKGLGLQGLSVIWNGGDKNWGILLRR